MIFSLFKLDNVVKKVELISIQARGGLTPDSVFCLKPEMGAGGGGLKKNMKRQTDPYGKAMKK